MEVVDQDRYFGKVGCEDKQSLYGYGYFVVGYDGFIFEILDMKVLVVQGGCQNDVYCYFCFVQLGISQVRKWLYFVKVILRIGVYKIYSGGYYKLIVGFDFVYDVDMDVEMEEQNDEGDGKYDELDDQKSWVFCFRIFIIGWRLVGFDFGWWQFYGVWVVVFCLFKLQ